MKNARTSILLLILSVLLAGCGGGGGDSGGGTAATARAHLDIAWAGRSREVIAPSSALSAVITLQGAAPDGSNVTFTVDRNDAPAAYTQTYTAPADARVGTFVLSVRFFANKGGQGALVAQASLSVAIKADGTLTTPNGSQLPPITPAGTIVSTVLVPGQQLLVGETRDLTFEAKDASGNVVAVTPGSASFVVTTGAGFLDIRNGQAVGLAPGDAMVTVSVDGKVSTPTAVKVYTTGGTATRVKLDVQWSGRTRDAVKAPTSALSAVLILEKAALDGGNFFMYMDRDENVAAHVQSYTSTKEARPGLWKFTIKFYSERGTKGVETGRIGGYEIKLLSDGTMTAYDGSPLFFSEPSLYAGSVRVAPGQTLGIGEQKDLAVEVRDRWNNVMPITYGSLGWSSENTSILRFENGKAVGVAPGIVRVNVSVDGKSGGAEVVVAGLTATAQTFISDPRDGTHPPVVQVSWQSGVPNAQVVEVQLWRLPDHPFDPNGVPVLAIANPQTVYDTTKSFWTGTNSFHRPTGSGASTIVTPPANAVPGFTIGQTYTYQIVLVIKRTNSSGGTDEVYLGPSNSGPATPLNYPTATGITTNIKQFNVTWLGMKGADEFQVRVSVAGYVSKIYTAKFTVASSAPNQDGVPQTLPSAVDLTKSPELLSVPAFYNWVRGVAGAEAPQLILMVGARNSGDQPGPRHLYNYSPAELDRTWRWIYTPYSPFKPTLQ
jgi:hypothetical protein